MVDLQALVNAFAFSTLLWGTMKAAKRFYVTKPTQPPSRNTAVSVTESHRMGLCFADCFYRLPAEKYIMFYIQSQGEYVCYFGWLLL